MPVNTPVPQTPAAWKIFHAKPFTKSLPYTAFQKDTDVESVQRDIYVDAATANFATSKSGFVTTIADVVGFPSQTQKVTIGVSAVVNIYTRVLTCTTPLTLDISSSGSDDSILTIYASVVDQPVSFTYGGNLAVPLVLGELTGNYGAQITISNGRATVDYLTQYDPLEMVSPELLSSVQTQLRIASIYYWTSPKVALSMVHHITCITQNSKIGGILNLQAGSLKQQLLASYLTGPGVSYAPVLSLESYKKTLGEAIDVAAAFDTQYNRFVDRQASIKDQKDAWDTMLGHTQDTVTLLQGLANEAKSKFDNARTAVAQAQANFKEHIWLLQQKEATFRVGLDVWKEHMIMKAVFDVAMAIVTFAIAIAACIVVPAPPVIEGAAAGLGKGAAAAGDAAQAASRAASLGKMAEAAVSKGVALAPAALKKLGESQAGDALKNGVKSAEQAYEAGEKLSGAIDRLGACIEKLGLLIDSTTKMVDTCNASSTPVIDVNDIKQDFSTMGNADSVMLSTLAVWDEWRLEADSQMSFITGQDIDGAQEYQLELMKHAIDGKLICQLQAQYVKAGQEYAQQLLQLSVARKDLERLQTLHDNFNGEIEVALQAQAIFYDRLMMIRTSVLIGMRKVVWAYKYLSLSDSSVNLDPLKSINDLRADASLVSQEIENYEEKFSSDNSPFKPPRTSLSQLFPITYGDMINSVKTNGFAAFTLSPSAIPSASGIPDSNLTPGPFVSGSHFRIFGMRAYLVGAVPKKASNKGRGTVTVGIQTTGLYMDIDTASTVLTFQMLPLNRQFSYTVPISSANAATTTPASAGNEAIVIDSIFQSKQHIDPTPFASWVVRVKDAETLDLSNLTDVELEWEGTAQFDGKQGD